MVDIIELFTMRNAFRLFIGVFMFGYTIFAFFFMLRIRVLSQTFKTEKSRLMNLLAQLHLVLVFIGSIIVGLLILL